MDDSDARASLSLLGHRLERLEFIFHGSSGGSQLLPTGSPISTPDTIHERLTHLEGHLRRLTTKHSLLQDLLRLYSRFPDLFGPDEGNYATSSDISTLASIVLAHASAYPETASRLSSLKTLSIPEASASAHLIDLKPRMEQAMSRQDVQEKEVAELRARSARLVEWWVHQGVVGMGECWADWEARVQECSNAVRVMERRQARDDA